MKKIISIMLSIVMAFTMLSVPVTVMADTQYVDGNDVEYQVTGGYIYFDEATGTITGCHIRATKVNIPAKINNIIVTSIGEEAFADCSNLTSITIPDSVTSIGDDAFGGCVHLTSITIPDSVTSIGDRAFWGCGSLTSIALPDSVTSIGDDAFWGCSSLTNIDVEEGNKDYASKEGCLFNRDYTILVAYPTGNERSSYTIPDGVTSIGNDAFGGCKNLTSITVPNGVTSIGNGAFSDCWDLTSITVSDSVTSIGTGVFVDCRNLTSIDVEEGNKDYASKEGCLFNRDHTILMAYPAGNERSSYTIPNSVTSIGDDAFHFCKNLTSIMIPDSVTSIGDDAFSYCESLTSITVPDSVTSIDFGAFNGCDNLTIYGYSGSYAETYAKGMNIKFVALEDGGIRTSEPLNISEDDLFGEYTEYLYNNEAYKALLSNLYGTFEKASYKTSDDLSSAVKLSMITVGSFDIIRYVKLMAGIDDTDEKIAEEMAVEILRGAENHSDTLKYFLEKVENNYKWTSRIQTVVSGGLESESATVQLAQFLGSGSLFSDAAALKVIKVLKKDAVGDGLTVAGYAVNVAQISCEVVMTMEVNHEILTTMMDNVSKNSTLYGGLESIEQKQKNHWKGILQKASRKTSLLKKWLKRWPRRDLSMEAGRSNMWD